MSKAPLERAARAICTAQDLPENTMFEGRPMWESFLPAARVALEAVKEPSEAMHNAAQISKALIWSTPPREGLDGVDWDLAWRAMIDAALSE